MKVSVFLKVCVLALLVWIGIGILALVVCFGGIQLFVFRNNILTPTTEKKHIIIEEKLHEKYGDEFEVISLEEKDFSSMLFSDWNNVGEATNLSDGYTFNYKIDLKCKEDVWDDYLGKANENSMYEDVWDVFKKNDLEKYNFDFDLILSKSKTANTLDKYKEEGCVEVNFNDLELDAMDADNFYKLLCDLDAKNYVVEVEFLNSNNELTYMRVNHRDEAFNLTEDRYRNKLADAGIKW